MTVRRFQALLAEHGCQLSSADYTTEPFKSTNAQQVDDEDLERLREACERYCG